MQKLGDMSPEQRAELGEITDQEGGKQAKPGPAHDSAGPAPAAARPSLCTIDTGCAGDTREALGTLGSALPFSQGSFALS